MRTAIVRRAVWGAAAALLLGAWADAQTRRYPRPRRVERLELVRVAESLDLDPLRTVEILGFVPDNAVELGAHGASAVEHVVSRRLTHVWEAEIDPSAGALDVRYEIVGHDGRSGVLTLPEDPDSVIRVHAIPTGPDYRYHNPDTVTATGGVVLGLDLSGVRRAGRHDGRLMVTVHRF